jgi:hypothetical protein
VKVSEILYRFPLENNKYCSFEYAVERATNINSDGSSAPHCVVYFANIRSFASTPYETAFTKGFRIVADVLPSGKVIEWNLPEDFDPMKKVES